jgi:hypothetical protein
MTMGASRTVARIAIENADSSSSSARICLSALSRGIMVTH